MKTGLITSIDNRNGTLVIKEDYTNKVYRVDYHDFLSGDPVEGTQVSFQTHPVHEGFAKEVYSITNPVVNKILAQINAIVRDVELIKLNLGMIKINSVKSNEYTTSEDT